MAARDEAGRAWTGVPQGQSADEESADEKMGPALPASHGPRTWDGGQVPCEGRPDTRWSGQAPSREPRGRSRFRPADCVRTEEITLDTVNPIQGGIRWESSLPIQLSGNCRSQTGRGLITCVRSTRTLEG